MLNSVIKTLERRIDDLENHSRRSNLIVYGLPEEKDENSESLEEAVNSKVIADILELDPVTIESIHRLGKPAPNRIRPIIFKLLDFRNKAQILKRGAKLKDTGISIGEDFSRRIRDVRKKLWDSAKQNRLNKEKVSLAFDKLYINKQCYKWDDVKNERVLIKKNDLDLSRPMTRQRAQSLSTPDS